MARDNRTRSHYTDTSHSTFVGKGDEDECDGIKDRTKNFADILKKEEGLSRQEFVELVGGGGAHTRIHWFARKGTRSVPDGLRMYRMMQEAQKRGLLHVMLPDES